MKPSSLSPTPAPTVFASPLSADAAVRPTMPCLVTEIVQGGQLELVLVDDLELTAFLGAVGWNRFDIRIDPHRPARDNYPERNLFYLICPSEVTEPLAFIQDYYSFNVAQPPQPLDIANERKKIQREIRDNRTRRAAHN